MGGGRAIANTQRQSADLIFEQLQGELDAAIVFAAGAEDADRNGQTELALACRADAVAAYASVLARLSEPDLLDSQRERLRAKLVRLRQLLDRPRPVRTSAPGEAA